MLLMPPVSGVGYYSVIFTKIELADVYLWISNKQLYSNVGLVLSTHASRNMCCPSHITKQGLLRLN